MFIDGHKLHIVPGTGLLSAKHNQLNVDDASQLKRGTGKHSHIVLIPQPSNDPRDPCVMRSVTTLSFNWLTFNLVDVSLNWPRWRKEMCFWTL